MINRTLTAAVLSLSFVTSACIPALADGAASTRNILLGGAAAAAGTLLIINHNKHVHQRYADDARRQADTQAQANNAQAAYAAERRAYENEVAINGEFKHEVATQHSLVEALRKQLSVAKSDLHVAQGRSRDAIPAPSRVAVNAAKPAPHVDRPVNVATTSWGWGQL